MSPRIVVLGAGINGLSSAVCVQQACPLAQVQLVSEHYSPDTTGDGSAGLWLPYLLGKEDAERSLRVCVATYRHLMELASSPQAGLIKVQKLSGYDLYTGMPTAIPAWTKSVEGFRQLTQEEMKQYPTADSATFFTSVNMDVPHYMNWLMKRFKSRGGILRQRKVEHIEEIGTECDILINCSALSAWFLFKDEQVYPTRGQVWKVHAPWIKHFSFAHVKDKDTAYVIPGVDHVTVGGTAQAGDWNTQPDPRDGARIWEQALHHWPELTNATPVLAWAGLRPTRPSLRLEPETVTVHGRNLKVIHNYGHGGSGSPCTGAVLWRSPPWCSRLSALRRTRSSGSCLACSEPSSPCLAYSGSIILCLAYSGSIILCLAYNESIILCLAYSESIILCLAYNESIFLCLACSKSIILCLACRRLAVSMLFVADQLCYDSLVAVQVFCVSLATVQKIYVSLPTVQIVYDSLVAV
ncbi:hypothetical protein EGW08_008004 [Elysia chlorotica]|uniref:FAD dependent oxidoreductase domain-containing protein n=1 Tax=Elysia chlorotica TaxID=188477 RepID=A0A433TRM9_ELYCH|nr:hypothetical protein EGW08_008004 [Elysia chlorotica]